MKPINTFKIFLLIFLIHFAISGCSKKRDIDIAAYQKEIEQWRNKREEGLKKENGWLTLCGLFWLKDGENKMGTDSSNAIIFPPGKAPKYAGSIYLRRGELLLKTNKKRNIRWKDSLITSMKLKSDEMGAAQPTILSLRTLTFYVIKRGDQLGVRVKDNENPARMNFKGLEYYTTNPEWRVNAKFKPYIPPKILPIVNILNQVSNDTCPGAIVFKIKGKEYQLDALRETGSNELFIIFSDETSGKETYGMGRYLYTALPDSNGNVIIDFNKAYNPPCAFTIYATCPVPPKQNHLPFRVEAGEKKYAGSEHLN